MSTGKRKLGAHVSSSGGLLNVIKNTEEIGANCMQIFAGSPRMWKRSHYPEEMVTKFLSLTQEKNLGPIVIHALYLTNLASDKKELREKTKKAIITDMENAAAIESLGVVLHIGSHQGRGFDVTKDIVVDEIKEILAKTPSNSTLLLENSAGQKGKIGSLAEIGYILDKINSSRVQVCIDTAHAFEAGHSIHTDKGQQEFINEMAENFGLDRVKVLHLNDSKTEFDSRHDQHANLGEGFIGRDGLTQIVNHAAFRGLPIILEVPGFDGKGPDKKNMQILEEIAQG